MFKVWDRKQRRMYYPYDNDNDFVLCPDGQIFQTGYDYREDVDLCRYTCLKDKNSKEIYEGDIVALTACERTGICYPGQGSRYRYYEVKFDDYELLSLLKEGKGKVIGNIYENPELIE